MNAFTPPRLILCLVCFFLIQHLLKKFLGLVHKFKLPVFLVDTASLTLLSQDAVLYRDSRLNEPHCSFFCTHRDFTTFALYGNLWKYDVRKSIQSCWKSLLSSSQDLYHHEVTKYIMTGTWNIDLISHAFYYLIIILVTRQTRQQYYCSPTIKSATVVFWK